MGFFTARKRNNPFAERAQQQRAQQRSVAKSKPAPKPKPTPEEQRDTDQPLGDLREVAKLAGGGVVGPIGNEEATLAKNGAPEFIIPLKVERCCGPGAGCDREDCTGEPLPDAVDFERTDTPENYPGPRGAEIMRKPDPEPEPEPEQPKRGRGRPRPQETIDRDNAVHNVLRSNPAGVSKAELARALGEKEQQVYSSLRQLTKEGRAKNRYVKDVGYRWFAA